jgi:glucose-1-phosphate adenylyltransferase
VLALVLAGGEGGRLGALTEERAKPSLPYGGTYRLIDFPLSNCVHSGLSDVWVLQQYEPHELTTQLANGRPWDLDRTRGGFRIVHPYLGDPDSGWYRGNADALHRNTELIGDFASDLVLVLSADHVYKLDYRTVIDGHVASEAVVTIVTVDAGDDASRYGVVEAAADGAVTGFEYKSEQPRSTTAAAEVFLYDTRELLATLTDLASGSGDDGLGDFGDDLLPRLVSEGKARAHPLAGYWQDVGTIDSYWQSHMDLLAPEPELVLDDPRWPILTAGIQRAPARVERSAGIDSSWIAPGARVDGAVERSVLGPGVVVEAGAVVRQSVLFHDAHVGADARVERAILDETTRIEPGATIGGPTDEIAVIPRGAQAPDGH